MGLLRKIKNKAHQLYQIHIAKDPFYIAHKKWVDDQGDQTLRLNYPLNQSSIVFDVGAGYIEIQCIKFIFLFIFFAKL